MPSSSPGPVPPVPGPLEGSFSVGLSGDANSPEGSSFACRTSASLQHLSPSPHVCLVPHNRPSFPEPAVPRTGALCLSVPVGSASCVLGPLGAQVSQSLTYTFAPASGYSLSIPILSVPSKAASSSRAAAGAHPCFPAVSATVSPARAQGLRPQTPATLCTCCRTPACSGPAGPQLQVLARGMKGCVGSGSCGLSLCMSGTGREAETQPPTEVLGGGRGGASPAGPLAQLQVA